MNIQHTYAVTDPKQSIGDRFDRMVKEYPERPAVSFKDERLSYRELGAKTDRLARTIISLIGTEQGQVALYLEHGISQPIAILASLKAGKTYVALDTSFPAERNMLMLENSDSQLIITNNLNESQVKSMAPGIIILNIDKAGDKRDEEQTLPEVSPESYAFITYTSGSTGIPKGVVHTHSNMLDFIMRMYTINCTLPEDRWAYYYSLSFSAHAMAILGALLNGAELCIFDLKKDNFTEFSRWLRQEKVTTILMIPSVLRQFIATLGTGRRFPQLIKLLIGGETLYRSDIDKIRDHLKNDALIYNIYASSEAYLARAYKIESDTVIKGNNVPIGYAVPGMDISIEEESDKRADPFNSGEICITSKYVARGYWKQDELTARDFTFNDDASITFRTSDLGYKLPDGCIVHNGRSDSMIKLRGFRIDLGEIENSMMNLKQVREVAVAVKENAFGTKHIIAYYVKREGGDLDPHYLKLAILRNLPDYMVPAYFIPLDHLPKNNIGKVDHKQLPEPDWNALTRKDDIEMPSNSVEEELKEIFERILEVSPIGVTENIMEVGADSLRLFVAFDEVEKRFGKKLNVDAIIEKPFIKDIAGQVAVGSGQ